MRITKDQLVALDEATPDFGGDAEFDLKATNLVTHEGVPVLALTPLGSHHTILVGQDGMTQTL